MRVETAEAAWIVPPPRALWLPPCCALSIGPAPARGDDIEDARFHYSFPAADLWRDGRLHATAACCGRRARSTERRLHCSKSLLSGGHVPLRRSGALDNALRDRHAMEEAQVLPGWRFKRDTAWRLKVFAGLDIKNDVTGPYDPAPSSHDPSHFGAAGKPGAPSTLVDTKLDAVRARHAYSSHDLRLRTASHARPFDSIHRLFGAPRLWLAAHRLVLSRPRGAGLHLRGYRQLRLRFTSAAM